MRYSSCLILLVFLSLSQFNSLAENVQVIDSLQLVLEKTKDPSLKINLLLELSNECRVNDGDKAIIYANQAYELAVENDDYNGVHESLVKLIFWFMRLLLHLQKNWPVVSSLPRVRAFVWRWT